ncbi:hypothetical protein F5146DRAFT_1005393 [Armillaria mellea]|nr:hypothetical protein F5146DRAFT_1005393 [Armillaria mellea]
MATMNLSSFAVPSRVTLSLHHLPSKKDIKVPWPRTPTRESTTIVWSTTLLGLPTMDIANTLLLMLPCRLLVQAPTTCTGTCKHRDVLVDGCRGNETKDFPGGKKLANPRTSCKMCQDGYNLDKAQSMTNGSVKSSAKNKASKKKCKMIKKDSKYDTVKLQGTSKTIKGVLIQSTPQNKPKSAVTITFKTQITDLVGDELKVLKGYLRPLHLYNPSSQGLIAVILWWCAWTCEKSAGKPSTHGQRLKISYTPSSFIPLSDFLSSTWIHVQCSLYASKPAWEYWEWETLVWSGDNHFMPRDYLLLRPQNIIILGQRIKVAWNDIQTWFDVSMCRRWYKRKPGGGTGGFSLTAAPFCVVKCRFEFNNEDGQQKSKRTMCSPLALAMATAVVQDQDHVENLLQAQEPQLELALCQADILMSKMQRYGQCDQEVQLKDGFSMCKKCHFTCDGSHEDNMEDEFGGKKAGINAIMHTMLARRTGRGMLCASTKYCVLVTNPQSWYLANIVHEAWLLHDVGRIKLDFTLNLIYHLLLSLHKLIASPTYWSQLTSTLLLWSLNKYSPKQATKGANLAWSMVGFKDYRDYSDLTAWYMVATSSLLHLVYCRKGNAAWYSVGRRVLGGFEWTSDMHVVLCLGPISALCQDDGCMNEMQEYPERQWAVVASKAASVNPNIPWTTMDIIADVHCLGCNDRLGKYLLEQEKLIKQNVWALDSEDGIRWDRILLYTAVAGTI